MALSLGSRPNKIALIRPRPLRILLREVSLPSSR